MEIDASETLREGSNSIHKVMIDDQRSEVSISLENEVIEASVLRSSEVCNRAQFWGAVGIFIEKPHILNRRLCGVADLWWGKLSSTHTNKEGLEATAKATQLVAADDVSDKSVLVNTSNNLDNLVMMAWKVLQGSEGKSDSMYRDEDLQKIDELNEVSKKYEEIERTPVNEEKLLNNVKHLLRNTGFEDIPPTEGRRFEPWPDLTGGSEAVFAVVRRALPKQTLRFSTPLELVLLDGRRGRCSVASSMSRPPLLPCMPYHLQHQLGDSRLAVVCQGGNRHNKHPTCDTAASPPLDGTSLVDSEASPAGTKLSPAASERLQAGSKLLPAGSELLPAANEVSLADSEDLPANSEDLPADSEDLLADSEVPLTDSTVLPISSSGVQWLQDVVLPRVARWATQVTEEGATGSNGSLANVDLQAYSALYSSLKSKYAEQLVKSWTERTDPHKFVHEDIGIATYLLLLWAELPRPQRFIDLGCGNGLLVYILASEGHKGQGLDIKKRAIWDTFPPFVDLKEHVVRPHDGCLPSDADWLLGNHSDELTPWIPVMAARASLSCSFFVLPCCPHDFTAKFLRRNSSMSQYADYLDYVQEVGEQCGFVMERDRLKIPSTKRVCFVGRSRSHGLDDRPAVLQRLQQFIDKRVQHYVNNQPARKEDDGEGRQGRQQGEEDDDGERDTSVVGVNGGHQSQNGNSSCATSQSIGNGGNRDLISNGIDESRTLGLQTTGMSGSEAQCLSGGKLWSAGFVARGRDQRTRNCTQLRQDVKDDLVGAVVSVVLGTEPLQACSAWRAGACTPLREVAEALGPRRLQQLKKECGGLQTLLRNHRHIFAVQRGTVTLRSPGTVPEDPKRHRPCWFFLHHPQGCPNSSASCIYDHEPPGSAGGPVAAQGHGQIHV